MQWYGMYNDRPGIDTGNAMAGLSTSDNRAEMKGVVNWGDHVSVERKHWDQKYIKDDGGVNTAFSWIETASGYDYSTRDQLMHVKEHGGPKSAAVDSIVMRGDMTGDVDLQGGTMRAATSFMPSGYRVKKPDMPLPPKPQLMDVPVNQMAPAKARPAQSGYSKKVGDQDGYWGDGMAAVRNAERARNGGF